MSEPTVATTATPPAAPFVPQVLALVCERSVPIDELIGPDQRLRDAPQVYVLRFPCSGMIKPSLAQLALDEGWDGVLVVGCAVGDCHFREGNLWARERFLGGRAPNKFRRMDQQRVSLLWRAASEAGPFLSEVGSFCDHLRTLPPNLRSDDGKGRKRKR
ncbi:MAG: hydrogenase iron-sulfur subunit [Fimbriimonadaceae bacterium]|nr:hydrogenase iron-sulfur subunit [Fimbriimonadaceae bacterium]